MSAEAQQQAHQLGMELIRQELEVYRKRVDRYPTNTHWKFELGQRLKQSGNFAEANAAEQKAHQWLKKALALEAQAAIGKPQGERGELVGPHLGVRAAEEERAARLRAGDGERRPGQPGDPPGAVEAVPRGLGGEQAVRPGDEPEGAVVVGREGIEAHLEPNDAEILVRGAPVMRGYRLDPRRSAQAIDTDGFLHTGDIGDIDPRGRLRVVDRAKDLVISGGVNVSPTEVENVLATHPAVADVCVIGVADDEWGERVVAVVVAVLLPARAHRPAIEITESAESEAVIA